MNAGNKFRNGSLIFQFKIVFVCNKRKMYRIKNGYRCCDYSLKVVQCSNQRFQKSHLCYPLVYICPVSSHICRVYVLFILLLSVPVLSEHPGWFRLF